ncbi:MAG TPA: T9SS type A sorting domain-containing protein [Calditrichia bacterium]|nr:T9SS type A sorting domain-containing protein [Calditrichia bacterium]
MNNPLRSFWRSGILAMFLVGMGLPLFGQINVTFRANMATNPDTLNAGHFIQVRGAVNGQTGAILPGGVTISWDAASDLVMSNDGGDYWSITFQMDTGDTMRYKFWAGYDDQTGSFYNGGWEADVEATDGLGNGNRAFIAGSSDTTVAVQFYNAGNTRPQMWRPYRESTDSVAVHFRVNMAGWIQDNSFDPVNGVLSARGGAPLGGWDAATALSMPVESNSVTIGDLSGTLHPTMYSGTFYVHRDSVASNPEQQYKFVSVTNGSDQWEDNVANRTFTFSPSVIANDTTLGWAFFDNKEPSAAVLCADGTTITFRVSTEALEGMDLFDRGVGDKIYVIGAKGWGLPDDLLEMTFIPALQEWTLIEPFPPTFQNSNIPYKYFIGWDSSRVDSTSPNFIPELILDNGWEEPATTGGGNRGHIFQCDPTQIPPGDFGFDRQFFAAVPANAYFTDPITLTWSIDMRPATDPNTNSNAELFRMGTDSAWIRFDGSLFAVSQGWPVGSENNILLEDPDQDGIYTGSYTTTAAGWYQMAFIVAYSTDVPNSYVTNGGGFEAGRRYYQFVRPTRLFDNGGQFLQAEWPTSYNFPTIEWVENNLPFETPPDMTTPLAIDGNGNVIAEQFELDQNYPNPFNPETTVRYQVPKASDVKITVFNVIGQQVRVLVNESKLAGSHNVMWNGLDDHGKQVSSGIYFLQMKAGDFTKVRKMSLIR